jgi:hypothetical protein
LFRFEPCKTRSEESLENKIPVSFTPGVLTLYWTWTPLAVIFFITNPMTLKEGDSSVSCFLQLITSRNIIRPYNSFIDKNLLIFFSDSIAEMNLKIKIIVGKPKNRIRVSGALY